MDSAFLGGDVQVPTFFGYAKLEVKNFSEFFGLQSFLDFEVFRGGVQAPTFFGHTKFFWDLFLYRALWTLNYSGEGVWKWTL